MFEIPSKYTKGFNLLLTGLSYSPGRLLPACYKTAELLAILSSDTHSQNRTYFI